MTIEPGALRSRIDREEPVPEFHVCFDQRSAIGEGGGIDQPVDVTEALQRGVEDHIRRTGMFEIRRHEQSGRPAALDLSRRDFPLVRVPSRHHETLGASAGDRLSNGQAHALGRPCDHDHPPLHARLPHKFFSSYNFGSEILIVKFWKFHNRPSGYNNHMGIDKWNFFAKIVVTA